MTGILLFPKIYPLSVDNGSILVTGKLKNIDTKVTIDKNYLGN